MSCGIGHRSGSDSTLLWLWGRPAVAAMIRPLAWVLPYATGVAVTREKKKLINKLKVIEKIMVYSIPKKVMNLTSRHRYSFS